MLIGGQMSSDKVVRVSKITYAIIEEYRLKCCNLTGTHPSAADATNYLIDYAKRKMELEK